MPILAIVTGKDVTKDKYETLRKEVKWESQHPAGVVLHAAAFDDRGQIRVVDVWETEDAMNAFFEKRLLPALQKLGITPPTAEIFPAHREHLPRVGAVPSEVGLARRA